MFGTSEAMVFPALWAYPDALVHSRMCNLAGFGVVMAMLSVSGERIRQIPQRPTLTVGVIALGCAGMLAGALVGMGMAPLPWLFAGAAARGVFYGILTLFWIGLFVHLDDGAIGAAVSASLVLYALAGAAIVAAAQASPMLATALLVACPIACGAGCLLSRRAVDPNSPVDQEATKAPFRTRCLLYLANFAFGLMMGALLHYFAFYDTTASLLAFLGMSAVLFAVFAWGGSQLEAGYVYRAFLICFAIAVSAVLLLGNLTPLVATLVASTALAFLILYTIVIFTDTQARLRKPYWKVPGMCQVFAVAGMILASALFQRAFPNGGITGAQLVLLADACIIFVAGVFSPSARTRLRPWGFSSLIPAESPEAHLLRRCGELAQDHGLTSRELEVLQKLAVGMTKDQIAESLFISPATAKTHTRNIYAKLGVHSQRELEGLME